MKFEEIFKINFKKILDNKENANTIMSLIEDIICDRYNYTYNTLYIEALVEQGYLVDRRDQKINEILG